MKPLFIIAILLTSCLPKIKEGTVIEKKYEPEQLYVVPITHCVSNGKTTTTYITYTWMYDDADWLIDIEGYDERHQLKTRWINIPQEMYDTIKTGDWYCVDNMCHLEDKDIEQPKTN